MTEVQYNRRSFSLVALVAALAITSPQWIGDPSTMLAMGGAALLAIGGIAILLLLLDREELRIPDRVIDRIPRIDVRTRLASAGVCWVGLGLLVVAQNLPQPFHAPATVAGIALTLGVGVLSLVWPRK